MKNKARRGGVLRGRGRGSAASRPPPAYARAPPGGRRVDAKAPARPPVALIEHADVKRMLLAQKSYVEGALALGLYCAMLVDEGRTSIAADRDRANLLLDVLTPIAKSWPSQWCLEANSLAIQVHGGYGYTKEFDVEQCYRDNRLNAIHEGTHGIHGLDLLGRKVVMQDGAGLTLLTERINETIDKALESDSTAAYAKDLRDATQRLVDVTATLWAIGDIATTLANSTIYLEAAGHVVVAWMWLEQLIVARDHQGDFYDGKPAAAQYFYAYELPKVGPQFDLLGRLGRTTVDAQAGWV